MLLLERLLAQLSGIANSEALAGGGGIFHHRIEERDVGERDGLLTPVVQGKKADIVSRIPMLLGASGREIMYAIG